MSVGEDGGVGMEEPLAVLQGECPNELIDGQGLRTRGDVRSGVNAGGGKCVWGDPILQAHGFKDCRNGAGEVDSPNLRNLQLLAKQLRQLLGLNDLLLLAALRDLQPRNAVLSLTARTYRPPRCESLRFFIDEMLERREVWIWIANPVDVPAL